jgi:hypothetical protein
MDFLCIKIKIIVKIHKKMVFVRGAPCWEFLPLLIFYWTLNKKKVEKLTKLIQVGVERRNTNDPTERVSSGYV